LAFSDSQQPLSTHLLTYYVHHKEEVLSSSLIEHSTGSKAEEKTFSVTDRKKEKKTRKNLPSFTYTTGHAD